MSTKTETKLLRLFLDHSCCRDGCHDQTNDQHAREIAHSHLSGNSSLPFEQQPLQHHFFVVKALAH